MNKDSYAFNIIWKLEKLPLKQTALTRWIATDKSYRRNAVSRRSPDAKDIRLPKAWMKVMALELIRRRVSMAIGTKLWTLDNSAYLSSLLADAFDAAPAAWEEVAVRCEAATVSTMVTSHIRLFPPCQGIKVRPSGRLPSVLDKPDGSLIDGIPARVRARQIKSLMKKWRAVRPALRLQNKPCVPRASTKAPQGHSWGSLRLIPSWRPTAILIDSSSRRRPQHYSDRAWNQSPLTLSLLADAFEAASPAWKEVAVRCKAATVSTIVTSHIRLFPSCHESRWVYLGACRRFWISLLAP